MLDLFYANKHLHDKVLAKEKKREEIMNRESLKRHCVETCKRFKDVITSGTYEEHRLVLDLLEQTEWIPISERPPESSGVYIVTREFNDGFECVDLVDACYFDGTSTWYNDNRINHSREYLDKKIKAWMYLPQPYRTESEKNAWQSMQIKRI